MALIEIDGLPIWIAWWIFPWQTVSHNQMVMDRLWIDYIKLFHTWNFGRLSNKVFEGSVNLWWMYHDFCPPWENRQIASWKEWRWGWSVRSGAATWRFPESSGYPQFSSIYSWDFPLNHPAIGYPHDYGFPRRQVRSGDFHQKMARFFSGIVHCRWLPEGINGGNFHCQIPQATGGYNQHLWVSWVWALTHAPERPRIMDRCLVLGHIDVILTINLYPFNRCNSLVNSYPQYPERLFGCSGPANLFLLMIPINLRKFTIWLWLTVCHGKIHHAINIGKPSISIRAIYFPWLALLVITRLGKSPAVTEHRSSRPMAEKMAKKIASPTAYHGLQAVRFLAQPPVFFQAEPALSLHSYGGHPGHPETKGITGGAGFLSHEKKDLDTEKNLIMMEIEDARTENTLDLIVPYCRGWCWWKKPYPCIQPRLFGGYLLGGYCTLKLFMHQISVATKSEEVSFWLLWKHMCCFFVPSRVAG